jgi:hypothetical protein
MWEEEDDPELLAEDELANEPTHEEATDADIEYFRQDRARDERDAARWVE